MGGQSAAQRRAAAQAKVAEEAAKSAPGDAGLVDRIEEATGGGSAEGGPSARELQLEAQLAQVEAQLAAAREAGANPAAPAPGTAEMVEALQAVTATLVGMQENAEAARRKERGSFKDYESPGSVERSLHGSVSTGEHSGEHADHFVRFIARGAKERGTSQFNVVRKARHRFIDQGGEAVVTPGVHYDFSPNGEFVTDDLEVIAYLKRRPGFGMEFWILGEEPGAAPSSDPVLDRIIEARVALDVDALDTIEHAERAEFNRPDVLRAVDAARRSIAAHADRLGEGL